MNKDIKALLSIYTILILSGWLIFNNIAHKKELAKLNQDRIKAMEKNDCCNRYEKKDSE